MSDEADEVPPEQPSHPLDEVINQIAEFSPEDIRGTGRLGSLAFDRAPEQVAQILQTLRDLRLEDWDELPNGIKNDAISQANGVVQTLGAMRQLEASNPNAQTQQVGFQTALDAASEWFKANVRPHTFTALLNDALRKSGRLTQEQEETEEIQAAIAELQKQLTQARGNLEAIEPVLEAGREAAGTSGAEALAKDYNEQAKKHGEAADDWRWIFAGTCVLAVGVTFLVVLFHHPTGKATTAAAVGRFFIDLLVIGVVLYLVRIASLQYRVNLHLGAVARGKAAALETFARMVGTGTEPSTRDALATTLAQAVFTIGDTGLIAPGSDHITLIERVAAAGGQRATSG